MRYGGQLDLKTSHYCQDKTKKGTGIALTAWNFMKNINRTTTIKQKPREQAKEPPVRASREKRSALPPHRIESPKATNVTRCTERGARNEAPQSMMNLLLNSTPTPLVRFLIHRRGFLFFLHRAAGPLVRFLNRAAGPLVGLFVGERGDGVGEHFCGLELGV